MTKKTATMLVVMWLFVFFSCSGTDDLPEIRMEIIGGTKNVFNSIEPLRGQIVLDIEKILEIDSTRTESADPLFFDQIDFDGGGGIYLSDSQGLKVHKFRQDGTWVSSFSVRGEGPGELTRMGDLQILSDHIWIAGNWPLQIVRYGMDGSFEFDWRSDRFYNFYLQPVVIDDGRFLSVGFQQQEMAGSPERRRTSALFDFNENILQSYFTRMNVGPMILTVGSERPLQVSFTDPRIVPRIMHAYDHDSGRLYVLLNLEYRIEVKNLEGEILFVVHKENENRRVTEGDREELIELLAARMSPQVQEDLKERLPDTFCAVSAVVPLNNGYFALHRVVGVNSIEIDIFDREGRFVYTLLPAGEISDMRSLSFFGDRAGRIEHLEDRDVYRQYRIKNLPEVFQKVSSK